MTKGLTRQAQSKAKPKRSSAASSSSADKHAQHPSQEDARHSSEPSLVHVGESNFVIAVDNHWRALRGYRLLEIEARGAKGKDGSYHEASARCDPLSCGVDLTSDRRSARLRRWVWQ